MFGDVVNGEMALNEYGGIVEKYINEISCRYTEADNDYFVIMPNHIHVIIMIEHTVGAIHELPLHSLVLVGNRIDIQYPRNFF